MADIADLLCVKLTEIVSLTAEIELLKQMHIQVRSLQKIIERLTLILRQDLLEAEAENLGWLSWCRVVNHQSVLKDSHEHVVADTQIVIFCHARNLEHSRLARSCINQEDSMLALKL